MNNYDDNFEAKKWIENCIREIDQSDKVNIGRWADPKQRDKKSFFQDMHALEVHANQERKLLEFNEDILSDLLGSQEVQSSVIQYLESELHS